jgi:putative oxidoreductase
MMQRLFSTFPNSAPGTGLVCLRLFAAAELILDCLHDQPAAALYGIAVGLRISQLALGSLLLIGLWTPATSIVTAILEIWMAFSSGPAELHLARATTAASLSLLGPGAWSIDAYLYGRKRIDL